MPDLEQDADSQDLAEVFDETNTTGDDADEDQPTDPEDFDPDDIEEGEREAMLEEGDGVDDDDDDASPGAPSDAVIDATERRRTSRPAGPRREGCDRRLAIAHRNNPQPA